MYLAGDYFRKKGLLNKVKVHFYSGGSILFAVEKYAKTLQIVVDRYGIDTHWFHNLVEIDGPGRTAFFEDSRGERHAVAYSMIHVTPPQSAPDFIKQSPLAVPGDPLGWVDVDKHTLQHTRHPNIFGIGDATNTPNAKTGAAIRKQAPVLVENFLNALDGKPLPLKYYGYGSCPLVTGYGKLMLAEFDYDNQPAETFPFNQAKERYSMWLLKKYILPWLYWNRILRGTA